MIVGQNTTLEVVACNEIHVNTSRFGRRVKQTSWKIVVSNLEKMLHGFYRFIPNCN